MLFKIVHRSAPITGPRRSRALTGLVRYISFLHNSYIECWLESINPLRTIGSPVTHENWPMNWPNFAASPAFLGWPARNRHTAACIHRRSHLLRTPPVPVVWIMSEPRAVANKHKGHKRTIPIISSSFWMTVVLKGLYNAIFCSLYKKCNFLLAVSV